MSARITEVEYAEIMNRRPSRRRTVWPGVIEAPKKKKYRNQKTEVDGGVFDSKKEANRYQELLLLQRDGQISKLERQPKYEFEINQIKIGTYKPDFRYLNADGLVVVEDVKSSATKTTAYRLRKKMMYAFHGVEVIEV